MVYLIPDGLFHINIAHMVLIGIDKIINTCISKQNRRLFHLPLEIDSHEACKKTQLNTTKYTMNVFVRSKDDPYSVNLSVQSTIVSLTASLLVFISW